MFGACLAKCAVIVQVNASKLSIEKLKGQIDRHRTYRSLADITKGPIDADQELEPDEKEMRLHGEVEQVSFTL